MPVSAIFEGAFGPSNGTQTVNTNDAIPLHDHADRQNACAYGYPNARKHFSPALFRRFTGEVCGCPWAHSRIVPTLKGTLVSFGSEKMA